MSFDWEEFFPTASTVNLADPSGGWLEDWSRGGMPTASGIALSPEGALSLSAVWACANAVSEDIGKLPFVVRKRREDGGSDEADTQPAHWIVAHEFNPLLCATVGNALLEAWEMLWGNAYAEIVRDGSGRPVELWPIHPARVRPKSRGRELWYEVRREPGSGDPDVVFPGNMIHVRGMGDMLEGFSVVRTAREVLGLTAGAEQFGASFFGNDATMGVAVTTPADLKPEMRKALQESLGAIKDKKFRFVVLPGGVKPERMMVPPEDIQFLETRKFQGHEICRLFRVPAHKAGFLEDATFSNIEHQAIEYATDSLQPRVTRLEKEFTRKLISRDSQGKYFVKANMNALLRGDYATRTAGYRSLISTGVMTPNQAKVLEDMNPSSEKGMDKHWMQGAMQPIGILADGPPEPPPPAEAPEPEPVEPEGPEQVAARMRHLFTDAAVRCVRRERHALATRRAKGDPKTFGMWATRFYAGHREYVEQAFAPVLDASGVRDAASVRAWLDAWQASAIASSRLPEPKPEPAAVNELAQGAMELIR